MAGIMVDYMIRSLVDALPAPTVVLDEEGRLSAVNDAAAELMGGRRLGMPYITAFRQPAVIDAIEACQRQDGARQLGRYLGRHGDRDVVWHVHVARMAGRADLVLSFEDVSPLQDAEQMRRDFVANVSHELRTPLTALTGFIETLRGAARDDPEARMRFLDIMESEAGRMTRLVEDLLALSRVEETERMRPMDQVDLRELVCGTCNMLSPVAKAAQVELDCQFGSGALEVMGDEGQLRQVLSNLVENAIKYGRGGEKAVIGLERVHDAYGLTGPGIRLWVQDFGEGIAPHHIARLTERFYRVDTHRSREVGGTGLGLAIVKHIINRHRGRLRITSELGKGSTFSVVLPLT